MCRNHRGFVEATLAAAKLGASALYLNTMFAGPQLAEVTRREGPKALVYDEEFTDLLEGVDDSVQRVVGWSDGGAEADAELTLEQLIARRRGLRPEAAAGETALRDPHLGHDRDAEGGPALQPRRPLHARGADRQDPLPQPDDDDDRGAAVSLLGLLPLRDEPADRLDDGAAAALRPRGDAARGPAEPGRGAGGGAGDGPADPRPAGGDARPPTTSPRCGSPRSRARRCRASWRSPGWTASATPSTTSTARPRSPTRRSPPRRTCAPRPAPPAGRRAGPSSASIDDDGRRGPAGRGRADLRRQRNVLRGIHGRRQQGSDRRPALQRRRRPLSTPTAGSSSTAATTR